jgi:hypothetical protein
MDLSLSPTPFGPGALSVVSMFVIDTLQRNG